MSPGVRMESGHLKNRLPAIRYGRHFPQAGNRVFHGLYLYFQSLFIAVFPENANPRKLWFRALHEMRAMPYGQQTIF